MFEYRKCGKQCWPLETKLNESFVCLSSNICNIYEADTGVKH